MATDEYLTKKETALLLKVSVNTVSMWLWQGKLPYLKACGRVLIERSAIQAFLRPGGSGDAVLSRG